MKTIKTKSIIFGALGLMLVISCTDLETELYSDLTPETEYTTTDTQLAAILTAYEPLKGYSEPYFNLQELSTETSAAPAKFGPWDDGGLWARLHRHEWENNSGDINGAWNLCFSGVSTCNRLIEEFEISTADTEVAVIELRAIRALYFYMAMDMFGDVPLVTTFATAEASPSRNPKQEVFNYIVAELEELIPLLPSGTKGELYGRINSWSAMGILARVYLNAETYTGTPQWEKVATLTQQIIDGGQFSLEPNYFDNFEIRNEGSNENIFVVGHYPVFIESPDEKEVYSNLPIERRYEILELFTQNNVKAYLSGHRHQTIINSYENIQLVSGETTSKNFDKRPMGFRLWNVSKDSITHKFVPLVNIKSNQEGI